MKFGTTLKLTDELLYLTTPGRDIPKGTLRAIIAQAGLTTKEFIKLL
jgi:hypothetical protein